VPHAPQAAPAVPQELLDSEVVSHVPLVVQQPVGHEVASQTHWPVVVLHSWPEGQLAHVAPLAPQEVLLSLDRDSQVPSLQQPEHPVPPHPHAPFAQACPAVHALHAAPLVPHSLDNCDAYGTHVLPLQQPIGHELALQTH
jgi:hypothetical protein